MDPLLAQPVKQVRAFNRFYTRAIGALQENFLGSKLTLPETRVLYELAHVEGTTSAALANVLGMDRGYLSRLLQKLQRRRLVRRQRSGEDARQAFLSLTPAGRKLFAELNRRQETAVEKLVAPLPPSELERMVGSMAVIESVLNPAAASESCSTFILRTARLGDMGWVVLRHGEGYADVYGWDERFEALVAKIVSDFHAKCDPMKERCWIAERDGERVGCVYLVRHPELEGVAKLRLLWVDPRARGLGLGKTLVHECTVFAKQAGYKKIVLWTNSELAAARAIYEREGYKRVKRMPDPIFPTGQFAEEWELPL
jgi:DNA-binding MarR family transcriptional regulator/ribosomal protein S18 acetylase RimI-like enzyme